MAANASAPDSIPQVQIGALREIVAIAEAESQEAGKAAQFNWRHVQIAAAEAARETAGAELRRAEEVNVRSPGAISKSKMSILQLKAEVAGVALERARAASGPLSMDDLPWQSFDLR